MPSTDVRFVVRGKCGGAHVFGTLLFSHSCTIKLTPLVSESLPKGNDFELSHKNGSRESGVSRLGVLIG